MVGDELVDGTAIGQLLSSEIHGHERGVVGVLRVVDADPDAGATEGGTFAYGIDLDPNGGDPTPVAEVYLHPDRVRIEFLDGIERAAEAAGSEGLRARPKAVEPPRTLVFVENGAEVKRALRVVRAAAEPLDASG